MDIPKKFCHHCGLQLLPASKFCSRCGTSQASIDEKPPVEEPKQPIGRVQRAQVNTFEPFEPGRQVLGSRRRNDDDDDEGTIRADRVESLAELGISMGQLELDLDVADIHKDRYRENCASVVKGGLAFGAGYKEPPRPTSDIPVSKDEAINIMRAGAAIRPGNSTEIK